MTKTATLLLFSLALLSTGCVTCYCDAGAVFRVQGEIVERETGIPLSDATVCFLNVDMGIGESKRTHLELGRSDSEGRFDARFKYYWATHLRLFFPDSGRGQQFEIVVSKRGYYSQRIEFERDHMSDMDG